MYVNVRERFSSPPLYKKGVYHLRNKERLTDIENRRVVAGGEGRGSLGLADVNYYI